MSIQIHIEADNFDDLIAMLGKFIGGGTADAPRRTRTTNPKADGAATGAGAAAELPAGMAPPSGPIGTGGVDDMFSSAPQAQAQTQPTMTLDGFLAAVKALLGKGKDDAIRNKVAEMGFARVRDVPPDKFASVLETVSKL